MAAATPPRTNVQSAPRPPARGPIMRRWLLNVMLLVVVAGLGLFAWYRSGHEPEETKPLLTELSSDTVQKIEIERAHQPDVGLERSGESWRVTAPIKARAETFAVNSLLRLLRAPVDGTIETANADLSPYGLDRPQLSVRFDAAEIDFGQRHPLKDEQYVKYGPTVRLISSLYYTQAAVPYTNLLDSRLIEPDRKLVSIKFPDFTLTLKDGAWVRAPEIKALSSDRINAFVDQWRHARALQVRPHSGEMKAQETVSIGFGKPDGDSTLTIGLLSRKPELVLYRADENLEYHFPEGTADRLLNLNEDEKS